jgi:PAS domain S-box-containing protein
MPTILNVDDRAPLRYARSRVLKEAGYRVVEAATGQEALCLASTLDLELVILSVKLPDMTGFEVCRKIKAHPSTAHVLVLHVSTTHPDSENTGAYVDTVADGYLVEPIQPQELLASTRALLRLAEREGENRRLTEQMVEQARLLNLSNDAIIVRALDDRIVYWNHGAEEMYGWKGDEAIGRNLYDLLGTQFSEPLENIVTQLHRDNRWIGECTQTRRDGARITVATRWALDRDVQSKIGSILQTDNDITLWRDAEERVRLTEELVRRINDVTPAILYVTELLDTRTIWDNRDMYSALGYSPEDSQRMGEQALHTLLYPEDWVRYRDHAERLRKLADGEAAEFDYRMRHADGTWRWLHSRDMVLQRTDDGHVRQIAGAALEITERKRAEEDLRRSHVFIRQIIDTDPNFIFAKDGEGRFTLVNQAVADCYGTTVEQLIGKTDADFNTDAEQVKHFRRMDVEVMEGLCERFIPEEAITDASGAMRWLQTVKRPIIDERGSAIQVLGISVDITKRKRTEEALRESEERLRLALAAGQMAAWDVDLANERTHWDAKEFALLGLNEGDVDPSPAEFYRRVHPDDRLMVQQHVQGAIDKNGKMEYEFRIITPDGQIRWLAARGLVFKNEQGRPMRMVGINFDVTERKRTEERLRSFTLELEWRVAERTQELVQSQDRLRALTTELTLTEQRERKRLAIDLHDYLAQLLVLIHMKLSRIKCAVSSEQTEMVRDIEQVVNEALTYTRTLVAQLSPTVLHDFGLPVALNWLGQQMVRQELSVVVRRLVPDDLKLPEDHAVLLFQSVRELLVNVRKHAGTNQALVTIEKIANELVITVHDNGAGVGPASPQATDTPAPISSKFGLFSIRERMRTIGGRFEIDSTPGKGTTARLILPLTDVESEGLGGKGEEVKEEVRRVGVSDDSEHPSPLISHASRIRVLLVDDHPTVRKGLQSLLQEHDDIEIIGEAENGEEAITLVDRLRPHVVLMDVHLPKLDGIETTRRIKVAFHTTAVIGLSVNTSREVEEAMFASGADAFFSKDAAGDNIYRAIRSLKDGARVSSHPDSESIKSASL